jgi:HD superfamily phosphohydrolase YqeK
MREREDSPMIFEAIAAIKIANEAIGAIKEFAGHVESVGQMGKDLTKLADAKAELQQSAADGDMEAFWALEDIKRHEAEVKQMFIYNGRAGLWDDYCKFIENRKMMRENERKRQEEKAKAKKKLIKDTLIYGSVGAACLAVVGAGIWLLMWLISLK